jgi:hypothetical protein
MCGIIDLDGTQWERCNGCGEFVEIDNLKYKEPSPAHPYGLDLCGKCFKKQEALHESIKSVVS